MSKPIKRAAAFLQSGKIFLHPYSHTTEGFWIFSTPVIVIGEGDEGIGRQVLRVLSESRQDVVHPKSWKGLTDPLLRAAGLRSFDAFAKSAKGVEIFLDDNEVAFIPTKNGGPRNAFLHLNDKTVRSEPSEEKIAGALGASFNACE
jgi:hypothetical protein